MPRQKEIERKNYRICFFLFTIITLLGLAVGIFLAVRADSPTYSYMSNLIKGYTAEQQFPETGRELFLKLFSLCFPDLKVLTVIFFLGFTILSPIGCAVFIAYRSTVLGFSLACLSYYLKANAIKQASIFLSFFIVENALIFLIFTIMCSKSISYYTLQRTVARNPLLRKRTSREYIEVYLILATAVIALKLIYYRLNFVI